MILRTTESRNAILLRIKGEALILYNFKANSLILRETREKTAKLKLRNKMRIT